MPLYSQVSSSMRRRPYNLEAKMRMKAYRRQAMLLQRQKEMDEELRTFELNPDDCYKKGDPDTVDGIVSDITSIGVIVDLPNGRQGLLPASQLGCMGGEDLLNKLFKIGQELGPMRPEIGAIMDRRPQIVAQTGFVRCDVVGGTRIACDNLGFGNVAIGIEFEQIERQFARLPERVGGKADAETFEQMGKAKRLGWTTDRDWSRGRHPVFEAPRVQAIGLRQHPTERRALVERLRYRDGERNRCRLPGRDQRRRRLQTR